MHPKNLLKLAPMRRLAFTGVMAYAAFVVQPLVPLALWSFVPITRRMVADVANVADNSTREGREQNRRVEIKLLVSRGINQNVEVKQSTDQQ